MKTIKLQYILSFLTILITINLSAQVKSSGRNIKITRFDVSAHDTKVAINLTTDGTVPTNYFEIQKSNDGINFKTIALILGPDPRQSSCDCYGCFDKLLNSRTGSIYYRARHIGVDGSEQLSESKLLAKL